VNINDLAAALRACAADLYPLEAGTELLIANSTFLHRGDFTSRFTEHGTSDGIAMAAIDWDAEPPPSPPAASPAPGANVASSNCQPASPPTRLSASATPSPASRTPTSADCSPPIRHAAGNDHDHQMPMAVLLLLNSRDSTQRERENPDERRPFSSVNQSVLQADEWPLTQQAHAIRTTLGQAIYLTCTHQKRWQNHLQ
jgi:hypothetical protein